MTQNTPGTNAGHPSGAAKPHEGKVVDSMDGKMLTDEGSAEEETP